VFVSDHSGLSRKDYLPALANDRLAASQHAEILGSLLPLNAPRVLEIRSKLGSLSAILTRLYRASCSVMTIFENQRFLAEEVYSLPAAWPIDFDQFSIPFDGTFDLIVSNHMLTHAVHPRDFLKTVRSRLAPGGYLYVYQEPLETEFLEQGKSMFNTLNPFHLQTFNAPSLVRALEANGFEVVFSRVSDDLFLALARVREQGAEWTPMSDSERARRRSAYRTANDTAILRVPEHLRAPFAEYWEATVARAVAAGLATVDARGKVRVRRQSNAHDDSPLH
jgi:SAM-dependent methyltransferase